MSILGPIPVNPWFGTTNVAELAPLVAYDPRTGYTKTRRWVGTPTAITGLQIAFDADRRKHEVVNNEPGKNWEIHAFYGVSDTQDVNEPLNDLWVLAANELEKSLWTLTPVLNETDEITHSDDSIAITALARYKRFVDDFVRGEKSAVVDYQDGVTNSTVEVTLDLPFLEAFATSPPLSMSWPPFRDMITAFLSGAESYGIGAYVLRHTLTVAAGTSIAPNYANVGRQYKTTTLVSVENIPTTILGQVNAIPGFWLKKTPQTEQISFDKFTITQEFWHADIWSTFIYGEPL